MATAPTPQTEVPIKNIPEDIQRKLRYPNVGLTDHSCPRDHCDERLVFTGTEHNDITDDAGYVIGHKERQTYECFAGHRVHERGPERNIDNDTTQ